MLEASIDRQCLQDLLRSCGFTWDSCRQAPDYAAGGAPHKLTRLAGIAQPDCRQGAGGLQDRCTVCAPQRSATLTAGNGNAGMAQSEVRVGRILHPANMSA